MSSNLRVDRILPSTGTEVGVGTATGSVALYGDVNVAGTLTYEDVTNIDSVGIITARNGIDVTGGNLLVGTTNSGGWLTKIQVSDNASYQSAFNITNNVNADLQVEIKSSETRFGPSTSTPLVFKNGGGERLRIRSDGDVYIGNIAHSNEGGANSSYRTLTLTDTTNGAQLHLRGQSPKLFLDVTSGGNGEIYYDTGDLRILSGEPGTTSSEKVRITNDGKVAIGFNAPAVAGLSISNSSTNRGFEFDTGSGFDSTSCIRAYDRPTTAYKSLGLTGSDIKFGINDVEKVRISSGGLAVNKNAAADTDIEIVQSADPTLRLHDTRNAAYKADFLMAGSAPVIRNNNTSASDRTLAVQKGTTDQLVIEGTGNVNIGANVSSNPFTYLRFGASQYGAADIRPTNEASHKVGLAFYTDGTQDTTINPTEKLRITSSGQLLLGTQDSTGTQLIKVNGDTGGTTYGGHIALTQGRTSPGNGATHGVISFGTETRPEVVKVVSFVDGTWTDGQYHPSGLYIATTDYNRNSPTEKIRITDIGEINCYSSGACIQAGTLQGGGYNVYFYEGRRNQNTGGTRTYIVWSNGNVQNTNNSYGSISDQRLKENIVDATSQWDDIKSLQIRKYNFREATGNETHTQIGLIAQEAESVSPGLVQTTAVSGGEVLQDADGNQIESVKSINYSVLYMKSVKALQEAQTRIEALEAAVAALQGS